MCGSGTLEATFINAGIPTMFIRAAELGFDATELQPSIPKWSAARFWSGWS